MANLKVEILAPDRPVAQVDAIGVTLPGTLGYMTILPDHATMVSELDAGELLVEKSSGELRYFIAGGYVDISDNNLKVLADVIEMSENIDVERAKKAQKRALDRLGLKSSDIDTPRAQRALKRAEGRINLARAIGGIAQHSS